MKSLLLYNSQAGLAPQLRSVVEQLKGTHTCTVVTTPEQLDTTSLLEMINLREIERIVVAGGDGSVHHLINQLLPHEVDLEIAVVPCGTGNDFARSVGIRQEHLERICVDPGFGQVRRLDVIQLGMPGHTFLINAASGGLGAEISSQMPSTDKRRWGAFSYWINALGKLADLHGFALDLEIDQRRIETRAYGLVICNGRFVGGGFPIAPEARLDDGCLDLILIPELPTLELLGAGLNYAIGLPEMSGRIQHYRGRQVHLKSSPEMIFSLDGEPLVTRESRFEVIPRHVKIVVHDAAPGLQPQASHMVS